MTERPVDAVYRIDSPTGSVTIKALSWPAQATIGRALGWRAGGVWSGCSDWVLDVGTWSARVLPALERERLVVDPVRG